MDTSSSAGLSRAARLLDSGSRWCAYALVFLIPLAALPSAWGSTESVKLAVLMILSLGGLTCALASSVLARRFVWPTGWTWMPIMLAGALLVMSAVRGRAGFDGWFGGNGQEYQSLLACAGFLATAKIFARTFVGAEGGRKFLTLLCASGLVTSVIALVCTLGFGDVLGIGFNTVGTVNTLAGFALMCAVGPFAFWLAQGDAGDRSVPKWVRGMALVQGLFAVIWLAGVDAWPLWLILILTLVAMLAFSLVRVRSFPHPSRLTALVLAGLFVGIFLLPFVKAPLHLPVPSVVSVSTSTAFRVTRAAIMTGNPLDFALGAGPGSFALLYEQYKPVEVNASPFFDVPFDRAKPDLLTTLAVFGVIPVALALAWMLTLLWKSAVLAVRERTGETGHVAFALTSLAAALLVFHAVYVSNLTLHWMLFAVFGVMSGLLLPIRPHDLRSSARVSLLIAFSAVLAACVLLIGGGIALARVSLSMAEAHAVSLAREGKVQEAITALAPSAGRFPLQANTWMLLSRLVLSQAATRYAALPAAPTKEDLASLNSQVAAAVEAGKRATDLAPQSSDAWSLRGAIYRDLMPLVSGAEDAAASAFLRAIELEPTSPRHYADLGRVYMMVSDRARAMTTNPDKEKAAAAKVAQQTAEGKAKEAFVKAAELKPDYTAVYYYLSGIAEREGRLSDAAAGLAAVAAARPLDVGVRVEWALIELRLRRYANAVKILEAVNTLLPENQNVQWYLALAYEGAGNLDGAKALLEKLHAAVPENENVTARLEAVRAGTPLSADVPAPVTEELP